VLKGHFRDQLAVAYWSQLKARTQVCGELLHKFAVAIKQLAHWVIIRLPEDFIHRQAAYTFTDRVKDQDVKRHLLMDSERSFNEALNPALKLVAAKKAARG
jgi:hypothetical protein